MIFSSESISCIDVYKRQDFIQDDNVPVPAEAAASTLLKEQLVEVLGTLTEREQKLSLIHI